MRRGGDRRILFDAGDEVWFSAVGGRSLRGRVKKLNPARARVDCGTGTWAVPYGGLHHVCARTAQNRENRFERLMEVDALGRELMARHGLADWSFQFHDAEKKLGVCRYREKRIQLSYSHAINGTPDQVTDTILHEIAHALAGQDAGHGPVWKAIARRLGAIPKSRAPESRQACNDREAAKANFRAGDVVRFEFRGAVRSGVIEKMNPKRARVRGLGGVLLVPYVALGKPEPA